jgi:hypothetical protein
VRVEVHTGSGGLAASVFDDLGFTLGLSPAT